LQYIDYPKWYSNEKIDNISEIVYDNLVKNENISENKINKLVSIVNKRINLLKEIIGNK